MPSLQRRNCECLCFPYVDTKAFLESGEPFPDPSTLPAELLGLAADPDLDAGEDEGESNDEEEKEEKE